jgi:flagellar hook-associated protein 2
MAIRLTGMMSGLDTESIIKGIVDAEKLKNKRVTDKQTLLTWKQEKWKELNTKLYKLYTDDLNKMRLQGSYLTKKVSSSNENLLEVTGGTTAPTGAHTISITALASSQYVTGGQITKDGVTEKTTLASLGLGGNDSTNVVIKITNGTAENNLIVSSTTTLGDFVKACKNVGLNASYDSTQKRLFISSKTSGSTNAFTISTGVISSSAADALTSIKTLVNNSALTSTEQASVTAALKTLEGTTAENPDPSAITLETLYSKAINNEKSTDVIEQAKITALKTLRDLALKKVDTDSKNKAIAIVKDGIKTNIIDSYTDRDETMFNKITAEVTDDYTIASDDKTQIIKERYAVYENIKKQYIKQSGLTEDELKSEENATKYTEILKKAEEQYGKLTSTQKTSAMNSIVNNEYNSTEKITVGGNQITKAAYYQDLVATEYQRIITSESENPITDASDQLLTNLKAYSPFSVITTGTDGSLLSNIGLGYIDGSQIASTDPNAMNVVKATNSSIVLDGATITGTTNTILVNGLTLNLKGQTTGSETVSFNVSSNTKDTYDMVKKFISSYNDILKEMNNSYYAPSAKGYDPLSDDEKDAMTDDQIEKWETKIKDSVLRRDTTMGSVLTSMKNAMQTSVEVNGKKYSLSSYGIQSSMDYTEKGLLHIYGNADDAVYSAENDKLMKALEEDPDTVMKVLSGISKNLYDAMSDKMKAIPNVSSALTFYNDKTMEKQQTAYKKQIAVLEAKVVALENKYYKQFAAMETAMAKLQSQSNALAGMLGTSNK